MAAQPVRHLMEQQLTKVRGIYPAVCIHVDASGRRCAGHPDGDPAPPKLHVIEYRLRCGYSPVYIPSACYGNRNP